MTARVPAMAWIGLSALVFVLSACVYWWFSRTFPKLWTHTDEYVYWAAGQAVRHDPSAIYNKAFGGHGMSPTPFIYPPFAALIFAVFSPLSFAVWQAGIVILDLLLLPLTCYLTFIISGHSKARAAVGGLLLGALAIWLQPVYMTMYFGQINMVVIVLCVADLALKDSSKWKGVGVGLAAAIKLTPLIFVVYLLATRRVRAGVVSLVTFAVTIAIGFAVLPSPSREYWGGKFASPGVNIAWYQNQSLYGMLIRALHSPATTHPIWLASVAVAGLVGLAVAVLASRRGLELLGVAICGVTGLLVSQISWGHHWVWIIPVLALTAGGMGRVNGESRVSALGVVVRVVGTVAITVIYFIWSAPVEIRTLLPKSVRGTLPAFSSAARFGAWLLNHSGFVVVGIIVIVAAGAYLLVTWPATRRAGDDPVQGRAAEPVSPAR